MIDHNYLAVYNASDKQKWLYVIEENKQNRNEVSVFKGNKKECRQYIVDYMKNCKGNWTPPPAESYAQLYLIKPYYDRFV